MRLPFCRRRWYVAASGFHSLQLWSATAGALRLPMLAALPRYKKGCQRLGN